MARRIEAGAAEFATYTPGDVLDEDTQLMNAGCRYSAKRIIEAADAVTCKRFTDAELAAEYQSWSGHMKHLQWAELSSEDALSEEAWALVGARATILYRFAELPHYDEDTAS